MEVQYIKSRLNMGNEQQEQNNYENEKKNIIQTESNSQVIYQPINQTKYREIYQIIPQEQNSNIQETTQYKKVYEYVPITQTSGNENYKYEKREIIYPAQVTTQQYYIENNINDIPRDSKRKSNYETEYYKTNYKLQNNNNKYKTGFVEEIPSHFAFQVYEDNPEIINNNKIIEYEEIQGGDIYDIYRGGSTERTYMVGGGGINAGQYRFEGESIEIKEQESKENIMIDEEEINNEILRRKNNALKGRITYELIDKYYAVTEVDPKALRKRLREEEKQYGENVYAYYAKLKAGTQHQQKRFRTASASKFSSGSFIYSYIENLRNKGSFIYPTDNFSKNIFEQINKIRTNPKSFISEIENAKSNIIRNKYGRIIYQNKIRIALVEGEKVFNEAIEFLNNCPPMDKLIFSPMITVQPPMNLIELNDRTDMRKKVEQMVNDGIPIKAFWRDIIKDPKISFLLMIIDDTGTKRGLRRQDILDPDFRYIGISSAEINGNFVCYMTFSPYL